MTHPHPHRSPLVAALLLSALLSACGRPDAPTQPQTGILGALELALNTSTVASQALTVREGDLSMVRAGPATVVTAGGYDYLRAQFVFTNLGSTPLNNLTLVAVAKSGNIGNTAIRSITDFGGITDSAQQTALARLSAPVHSTSADGSGTLSLISGAADFQAFTPAEVGALTTQSGWNSLYSSTDTPLNYGFVARSCTPSGSTCTPDGASSVAVGGSALVNLALRVPHTNSTQYNFTMNFALVDQDTARVTRSLLPPETVSDAEARLTSLSGGELAQVGSNVQTPSSSRVSVPISQVSLSTDGADLMSALTRLRSSAIGQTTLKLNADDTTVIQDASGTLQFTPSVFSDIDDVSGGYRYVTRTFQVTNLGTQTLRNVSLRALNLPANLGGTALVEARAYPTASDAQGTLFVDPAYAQSFRPIQRTSYGASRPEIDLGGASFQSYRSAESQKLQAEAGLPSGSSVLDYGFTTGGSASRTLAPGDTTLINVAYRFPRKFGTQAKTYTFSLSFLAVAEDGVRVSQGLTETRAQLQQRAAQTAMREGTVQVATTDGQGPLGTSSAGLLPLETSGVQVGTTTPLNP